MSWTMIEDNRAVDALLKPGFFLLAFPIVLWGKVFATGRVLFAIGAVVLGLLYFVRPEFSPGAKQMAAAIFLNSKVRLAATLLGILILLFGLIVWVPWLASHPEDVAGGNYLKDMGLAGGALLLAGALPKRDG